MCWTNIKNLGPKPGQTCSNVKFLTLLPSEADSSNDFCDVDGNTSFVDFTIFKRLTDADSGGNDLLEHCVDSESTVSISRLTLRLLFLFNGSTLHADFSFSFGSFDDKDLENLGFPVTALLAYKICFKFTVDVNA